MAGLEREPHFVAEQLADEGQWIEVRCRGAKPGRNGQGQAEG